MIQGDGQHVFARDTAGSVEHWWQPGTGTHRASASSNAVRKARSGGEARRRGGGGRGARGCRRGPPPGWIVYVGVSRDPRGPVRRCAPRRAPARRRRRARRSLRPDRSRAASRAPAPSTDVRVEHVRERQRAGQEGDDRALPEPQVVAERVGVGVRHPPRRRARAAARSARPARTRGERRSRRGAPATRGTRRGTARERGDGDRALAAEAPDARGGQDDRVRARVRVVALLAAGRLHDEHLRRKHARRALARHARPRRSPPPTPPPPPS